MKDGGKNVYCIVRHTATTLHDSDAVTITLLNIKSLKKTNNICPVKCPYVLDTLEDVGELVKDLGEVDVGELARRRNDRISYQ